MTTIYLHFGTQKTGSTSLQSYLHINRKRLRDQGVCYGEAFGATGSEKSVRILDVKKAHEIDEVQVAAWKRGVERDLARGCETLLYSEENLWPVVAFRNPELTPLRAVFSNLSIQTTLQPLVYLRRQDSFIASLYQENIKCAHFSLTLEEFAFSGAARKKGSYYRNLRKLDETLGNCLVKVLETEVREGGVLPRFCALLGVDSSGFADPATSNEGLEAHATEALRRLIERLAVDEKKPTQLMRCRDYLAKTYRGGPKLELSCQQKKRLMAGFEAGNRKLKRTFVGDDLEPFFEEPKSTGLTIEELSEERINSMMAEALDKSSHFL